MSTELKKFVTKRTGDVFMTRFWGGKEDGACLQLTVDVWNQGYFSVTREEARQLADRLMEFAEGKEQEYVDS